MRGVTFDPFAGCSIARELAVDQGKADVVLGIDGSSSSIPRGFSFELFGNGYNTRAFVADVRQRMLGAPEISSDAFQAYAPAIEMAFGIDVHYGQIEKHYRVEPAVEAARRYSPGYVVAVSITSVRGMPQRISTSFIERQNLTWRMQQRRFTRLTNAFSKKLEHHAAAVALYVAHYNLCRVHETLRITPAMHLGITDHIWTIGELVDAALDGVIAPQPKKRYGRFTVIEGGSP